MKPSGDLSYKGKRKKQIPRRFAPRDDNIPETAEAARPERRAAEERGQRDGPQRSAATSLRMTPVASAAASLRMNRSIPRRDHEKSLRSPDDKAARRPELQRQKKKADPSSLRSS